MISEQDSGAVAVEQQQQWILDNISSIEQYHMHSHVLSERYGRQLHSLTLPEATHADEGNQDEEDRPVERVEFDLKHAREHLGKLKFIFLELATKRRFLEELVLDVAAWEAIPQEWAPGPVKALERQVSAAKDSLKAIKERQADIKLLIGSVAEQLVKKLDECKRKRQDALAIIQRVKQLSETLTAADSRLLQTASAYPLLAGGKKTVSVSDLKQAVAQARLGLDKKRAAVAVQRQAIQDLGRLLAHQQDQSGRLGDLAEEKEGQLEELVRAQKAKGGSALGSLCAWYRGMAEMGEAVAGGVHCEVVRPDYLHVTVSHPQTAACLPIHLRIDPSTGRLLDAQVGSTAATPNKVQWREVIDIALATNDISFLIRQVHYRLIRQ